MNNPEDEFTVFDEMVLIGDLGEVELTKDVREQRCTLKAHFANVVEMGLEEIEEPEEA